DKALTKDEGGRMKDESEGPSGSSFILHPSSLAGAVTLSLACLAACLVNPYHVRAFTVLPTGLIHAGAMAGFRAEPTFRRFCVSPLEPGSFSSFSGLSAAGLSFFVLLGLGAVSFVLTAVQHREGLRWWRLLVWLGGAVLAAWNARAIPFFAVVAGPITSL